MNAETIKTCIVIFLISVVMGIFVTSVRNAPEEKVLELCHISNHELLIYTSEIVSLTYRDESTSYCIRNGWDTLVYRDGRYVSDKSYEYEKCSQTTLTCQDY